MLSDGNWPANFQVSSTYRLCLPARALQRTLRAHVGDDEAFSSEHRVRGVAGCYICGWYVVMLVDVVDMQLLQGGTR